MKITEIPNGSIGTSPELSPLRSPIDHRYDAAPTDFLSSVTAVTLRSPIYLSSVTAVTLRVYTDFPSVTAVTRWSPIFASVGYRSDTAVTDFASVRYVITDLTRRSPICVRRLPQ